MPEEVQVRISVVMMDIRSALIMFAVVEELLTAILQDIMQGEISGREAESWTDLAGMFASGQTAITAFQTQATEDPESLSTDDIEAVEGEIVEFQNVGRTIASTLENIGVPITLG